MTRRAGLLVFPGRLRFVAIAGAVASVAPNGTAVQSPAVPVGRSCHAMTFSPRDNGVVLFGGSRVCGRDVFPDSGVWSWTGENWSRTAALFPGTREDVLLSFDSRRNVLVLHGGRHAGTVFNDTWESDGSRWRQVSTDGPGRLEHAAAAFDPRRGRVVLFGGAEGGGRWSRLTWEWDGSRWQVVDSAGPAPRVGHSMVATATGGVFLYGGFNQSGQFRDLWHWNGTRWTRIDSAGVAYTEGPALVAMGDTLALVASEPVVPGPDRAYRVWRWAPNGWHPWGDPGPPGRIGQGLAWDPRRRRIVLYGGAPEGASTSVGEVWEFGGSWRRVP